MVRPFRKTVESADMPSSRVGTFTGITRLRVSGYKSIVDPTEIEIAPLTVLAGANSSGKSSVMQPLFLLKQTLEAPFDPGPLALGGPHITFTEVSQFLSAGPRANREMEIGVSTASDSVSSAFRMTKRGLEVARTHYQQAVGDRVYSLTLGDGPVALDQLRSYAPTFAGLLDAVPPAWISGELTARANRSFVTLGFERPDAPFVPAPTGGLLARLGIRTALHVPGLRGTGTRAYPKAAVGEVFSGPFDPYVASVVATWQERSDPRLASLEEALSRLGLTSRVRVRQLSDADLEIQVGRTSGARPGREAMVNIADVGSGVAQVLPLLVALIAAEPQALVYVEQPEVHLHPRAQHELARVLADASDRGVRVVVETHSSLLLTSLLTLVAQGAVAPTDMKLHWFQLDRRGVTRVTTADVDTAGAHGEWPSDFGDVELEVEAAYIRASERQLRKGA